jgi:hypothetical protein
MVTRREAWTLSAAVLPAKVVDGVVATYYAAAYYAAFALELRDEPRQKLGAIVELDHISLV